MAEQRLWGVTHRDDGSLHFLCTHGTVSLYFEMFIVTGKAPVSGKSRNKDIAQTVMWNIIQWHVVEAVLCRMLLILLKLTSKEYKKKTCKNYTMNSMFKLVRKKMMLENSPIVHHLTPNIFILSIYPYLEVRYSSACHLSFSLSYSLSIIGLKKSVQSDISLFDLSLKLIT